MQGTRYSSTARSWQSMMMLLLALGVSACTHGEGCEKMLDHLCEGWKTEGVAACEACVKANWPQLEENCTTTDKADKRCEQYNAPTPAPPTPHHPTPAPAAPTPAPPPVPSGPLPAFGPAPAPGVRPNFFLMLTDDQDVMLGSMDAMSFTRRLGKAGTNLTNFFAHTPVCCPSRSELLTGRLFHNLRDAASTPSGGEVVSADDCMHVNASMGGFEHATFANALQEAGYLTGMFGKYLNSGGMKHICPKPVGNDELKVPAGWSDFLGACPDTCYVNCVYNNNGVAATFDDPSFARGSNYGTSVVGNASLDFVRASLDAGKPFFAYVASHAPHGPATPAPWYKDLYHDSKAPRTGAWNVHSPDKHWVVATQPEITDDYAKDKIDAFYKNRLRSLRSVDDILHDAYALIASHPAKQLNNTYFIFTSDHGLHMGQFRLGPCKRQPYETDLRIPALLAGPGIGAGRHLPAVAGIPDLAPTVLALAGVTAWPGLSSMDGRSLAPLLASVEMIGEEDEDEEEGAAAAGESGGGPGGAGFNGMALANGWRDAYLIEYYATTTRSPDPSNTHLKDSDNNTFIGLRVLNASMDIAYFEFTSVAKDWAFKHANFCELYNISSDPNQLVNMCAGGSAVEGLRAALHEQLYRQYVCRGSSCP